MRPSRLMVVVIAALLSGAACGATEEDIVGEGPEAPTPAPGVRLVLDLEIEEDLVAGGPAVFVLTLRNEGAETAELTMPSGQKGDVVLTRDGEERYRWSAERAFTMALVSLELGPSEEEAFRLEEEALDVEAGTYELEATSTADPGPEPVRRTVEVRAS